MAEETIKRQMAATYSVEITGIDRTRTELARLDDAIHQLRVARYTEGASMTVVSQLGGKDVLVTKLDDLEGRVQTAAAKGMDAAMKLGKETQTKALNAAETPYGSKRFGGGRGGSAGRNDSGTMIGAITTNVETFKSKTATRLTGWHGWPLDARARYFEIQEKGGRKLPIVGANSLGQAIPVVREFLKKELGRLKK